MYAASRNRRRERNLRRSPPPVRSALLMDTGLNKKARALGGDWVCLCDGLQFKGEKRLWKGRGYWERLVKKKKESTEEREENQDFGRTRKQRGKKKTCSQVGEFSYHTEGTILGGTPAQRNTHVSTPERNVTEPLQPRFPGPYTGKERKK